MNKDFFIEIAELKSDNSGKLEQPHSIKHFSIDKDLFIEENNLGDYIVLDFLTSDKAYIAGGSALSWVANTGFSDIDFFLR